MIPAKSQILVATGIRLTIPKGHLATISSIKNPSPREPLVCPGVLDPAYSEELTHLVGNLTDAPLAVNPKLPIAYVHLLAADDLVSYGPCGLMRDLGLPDPHIGAVLPALDADLPPADHAKALALKEEYADLFSSGPHDFGLLNGTSHRLNLEDNRPFRSQPYRKSKVKEAQLTAELKQLLEAGLLTPSKSPWASPLLLLKKKDGGHRVVMDYCRLNALTKKDSYPLPRINDSLQVLGGSKYFSAMDLASGYWQVELSPEDREKCALISSEGLFEPTRMPQGLCNARLLFSGLWMASWVI